MIILAMKPMNDPEKLAGYLAETHYRDLFPRNLDQFAALCSAEAGDVLIRQGDELSALLFLVKGRCSVSCDLPNGKTILLKTVSAPSMLGELELISPDRFPLTVTALEYCELLAFPMRQCRSILLEDNAFLRRLCVMLGDKERQGALRFFITSGYPLDKRLAAFILEQREGSCFRVRKVQAAQSLGVSYRHLETVLKRFIREGILTKEKFTYTIRDEAALRKLASEISDVL